MKKFRTSVALLDTCVLIGALFMLWAYGQTNPNALWVLLLLALSPLLVLVLFAANIPKIWGHPKFGGGDNAAVITDIFGKRKDWRLINMAGFACNLTGSGYMIYAGQVLRPIGIVFLLVDIVYRLMLWTDTTRIGRRWGGFLGIPVTPEHELDIPLD